MTRLCTILSAALPLAMVATAKGQLITFNFSGTITTVSDYSNLLGGAIHVGDSFSGAYTFDSQSPNSPVYPGQGTYSSPYAVMNTTIGNSGLNLSASPTIGVLNLPTLDMYSVTAYDFSSGPFSITKCGFSLRDPTATAFSSIALPLTPPELSLFSTRDFNVQGTAPAGPSGEFSIWGTVSSLTPEPAALALLAPALFLATRRVLHK